MSIIAKLVSSDRIRLDTLLNFYPIYFFSGVKIKISNNCKQITIKVPLRWYTKNNSGVMFGGLICLASDPFPSIVFQRLIPGSRAWSAMHKVDYLKPSTTQIVAKIQISDAEITDLTNQLEQSGKARRDFEYYFYDIYNRQIARITSTTYLKKSNNN